MHMQGKCGLIALEKGERDGERCVFCVNLSAVFAGAPPARRRPHGADVWLCPAFTPRAVQHAAHRARVREREEDGEKVRKGRGMSETSRHATALPRPLFEAPAAHTHTHTHTHAHTHRHTHADIHTHAHTDCPPKSKPTKARLSLRQTLPLSCRHAPSRPPPQCLWLRSVVQGRHCSELEKAHVGGRDRETECRKEPKKKHNNRATRQAALSCVSRLCTTTPHYAAAPRHCATPLLYHNAVLPLSH